MSERRGYDAGTPSWVDVGSPDPDAAIRFYTGLFGWTAEPARDRYVRFRLRGKAVAGLDVAAGERFPPAWTTYISVADAGATTEAVSRAGGRVAVEPFDVAGTGRMAVLRDPGDAFFAIWQPGTHAGAELVNAPGTLCWNELATRDIDEARDFYRAVFGWRPRTNPFEGTVYTEWRLGDRSVGGMIQMTDDWPADLPSHWMVYFAVADCDASARRAEELGGKVPGEPTDLPPGRVAVLNDPDGAVFSIMRMADEEA